MQEVSGSIPLGSTNFRHHQFFRKFTALEGRKLVEPSGIAYAALLRPRRR
jgi:hypothetical protein